MRPTRKHNAETDLWHAYPSVVEGYSAHSACQFDRMCDLAQMLDEWCVALFGSEETKVPVEEVESKTEEIYGKMVRFYQDFAPCLQVKDNDLVTAPVLCTQ